MKKHLFIVSLSLLLLLTTACAHPDSDIPASNGTTTQPSVAETTTSTGVSDHTTTATGSTTTTGTKTTGSRTSHTGSTVTEIVTASQPRATSPGTQLSQNLPWTKPVPVPFTVEEGSAKGAIIQLFFSTNTYDFYRSYTTDTQFVLTNGQRITQKDLQSAVTAGTITPSQLMAVYPLEIRIKQASDTVSGATHSGVLHSFQSYKEAHVIQGEDTVPVYPPYDLIGEFYGLDQKSLGYYINAEHLRQLAESACPDRSFAALTTANGIRVGETLFVPLDVVETSGIHVEVQINQEHEYITGLTIRLPQ